MAKFLIVFVRPHFTTSTEGNHDSEGGFYGGTSEGANVWLRLRGGQQMGSQCKYTTSYPVIAQSVHAVKSTEATSNNQKQCGEEPLDVCYGNGVGDVKAEY